MSWRRAYGVVVVVALSVTCASALAGGAGIETIPNFGYVYTFDSGTFSVSETARGKGYSGHGTVVGHPWYAEPRVAGNLVKNTRFRPDTVQGTFALPFEMTRVANETKQTPNGTYRCRSAGTYPHMASLAIKLSVYPSAGKVLGRFHLYQALGGEFGGDPRCSSAINHTRLLAHQWFPLVEFTKPRFALRMRGTGSVDDSSGNRHTIRWNIVATFSRLRNLVPG